MEFFIKNGIVRAGSNPRKIQQLKALGYKEFTPGQKPKKTKVIEE